MKILASALLLLAFSFLAAAQIGGKPDNVKPVIRPMGKSVTLPDKAPQSAEEYYDYADRLWRQTIGRDSARVLELLNQAIKLKPDYSEAIHFRGFVYDRTDRFNEAIADYERALELLPDDLQIYISIGEVKLRKRDYQGALASYDKFIALMQAQGKVTLGSLMGRGRTKYLLGDYPGALNDYSRAISVSSGDSSLNFLRGLIYLKIGNPSAAQKDFKVAADYWDSIHQAVAERDPKAAAAVYTDPAEEFPVGENPLADQSQRNTEKSSRLIVEPPTVVSSVVVVGVDESGNRSTYKPVTVEQKTSLDYWFEPARFMSIGLGADFEEVAYFFHGMTAFERGDFAVAEAALTKYFTFGYDKNPAAIFTRGKVRAAAGKYEAAIRDFSWAIVWNRNFADAYLERGIALHLFGRKDAAEKDFAKYLSLNPQGKETLQQRIDQANKILKVT